MRIITFNRANALMLGLLTFAYAASAAPQAAPAEGVPVRITVTAVSKEKGQEPPALSKDDFLIYQNHKRRPVLNVVPATSDSNKLDLYILVDENIATDVTLNYRDIGNFIHELPSSARVGVLYALDGTVTGTRDATDNRDAAVKALRIPLGRIAAGGGVFLSLGDLAKRLPALPDRRRAILFLSSGIDIYRGYMDTYPSLNPDLETAINRLDRNGITVFPIYISPAGHFQRSLYLVGNGQSCLSYLADETGGEAFFQGFNTPVDMKPFLDEIGRHLNSQYLVTFAAQPGKKSGYESIHATTELSGVEVRGPARAYVPAEK
jgi:hypothetical protein